MRQGCKVLEAHPKLLVAIPQFVQLWSRCVQLPELKIYSNISYPLLYEVLDPKVNLYGLRGVYIHENTNNIDRIKQHYNHNFRTFRQKQLVKWWVQMRTPILFYMISEPTYLKEKKIQEKTFKLKHEAYARTAL